MLRHRESCGSGMGDADITDRKLIFAADLGGTHLRAAIVDQNGRIHSRFKQNTPQVKDAGAIVDAIVSAVREFQKAAEISAVSLVVPGTVKVEEGGVVKASNLPFLDGFRLAAELPEQNGRIHSGFKQNTPQVKDAGAIVDAIVST